MVRRLAVAASEPDKPRRAPVKRATPATKATATARKAVGRRALTAHEVQATVEGVAVDQAGKDVAIAADVVDFMGEQFKVAEKIGLMPMLKFAHVANQGTQSEDMEGMVALYAMIRECIDPEEWPRFERHAMDQRADDGDLMPVVGRAMEIIAARPTRPSGASAAGRQPTSRNSKGSSRQTGTRRPPPREIEGLVAVDSLTAL